MPADRPFGVSYGGHGETRAALATYGRSFLHACSGGSSVAAVEMVRVGPRDGGPFVAGERPPSDDEDLPFVARVR